MDVAVVNGRELDGQVLTFAPSGWTYFSTFVLWDYETGSMWLPVNCDCSPFKGPAKIELRQFQCISGKHADRVLPGYFPGNMPWSQWLVGHPESKIMDD